MIAEFLTTLAMFAGPGYVLTFLDSRLDGAERLAACALISSLLYAACALGAHLAGLPLASILVFPPVLAAASLLALRRRPAVGFDPRLAAVLVAALAVRILIFGGSPYPHTGDAVVHYSFAKSFLGKDWYTSDMVENYWTPYTAIPFPGSYRPPLEDLLHAVAMSLNTADYASAASMTLLFGASLIAAMYVLARGLFGARAGLIASALAAANYFIIARSIDLEPRMIVSYFVLAMLHFTLRGRAFWPHATAAAALAWLTHYSATWFIIAAAAHTAYRGRRAFDLRVAASCAALFLLLVSPWLVRNAALFGNPLYTTAGRVPFMTSWEDYMLLEPPTPQSYLMRLGGGPLAVAKAAGFRLVNMVTSYVPPPNKAAEYGLGWALSNSIFSLVGPLPFMCALAYVASGFRKHRGTLLFFTVALASVAGPLLTGYPKSDGVSVDLLSPITPILTIYAGACLSRHGSRLFVAILAASVILQTAWLSWGYASYRPPLEAMEWVKSNLPEGAVVMSVHSHGINYYTGLRAYPTPNAGWSDISATARRFNVTYYLFTPQDAAMRDVKAEYLASEGVLVKTVGDYAIYRLGAGA
jgi:hypothetical protein